ncbi:MAG: tetratricopeptide repeat protein [Thermoleophilia bacterium]
MNDFNYKWLLLIPVLLVAIGFGVLIPMVLSSDSEEQPDIIKEAGLSAQAEEGVKRMLEQISSYEELLTTAPDDVDVLKPLADNYYDLAKLEEQNQLTNDAFGHYKAAVDNYRKVLAVQPDNGPARLSLALAYNGLLMRDVAFRELQVFTVESLSALDTTDTDLLIDAALFYQEEFSLLPEAEALLGRATAVEPDNSRAWLSLGFVLRSQGRTAEATAAFEKVIAIDPNTSYADGAREYLGQ